MATDTTRTEAQALLTEVDKVSAVLLPEPMAEVVPLAQATPDKAAAIVPATWLPWPQESSYQLPVPELFTPVTVLFTRSS